MQILTNERRHKRGRFLATVFTISGILMLLSATIATLTLDFMVSSFPLMIFGVIISLVGIRLSNEWVRPPVTHDALSNALKGTSKEAILLNYYGPARHILIHPGGVFALVTRNRPFDLYIDAEKWRNGASAWQRFQRFLGQDTLGRPIHDGQRSAERASRWLEKQIGVPVAVQPIIVFLHPDTHLNVQQQPTVPVTYADKRRPSLKNHFSQNEPTRLDSAQIETLLASITSS